MFAGAVTVYTPWLEVSVTEAVTTQLGAALAELYIETGWCCYDDGLDGTGFFTQAISLADQFGDTYGVANANRLPGPGSNGFLTVLGTALG